MKKVAFVAVVLCSVWFACCKGDTERTQLWRDTVPRLTERTDAMPCEEALVPGRAVAASQCGLHESVFPCVAKEIEEDPAETLVTHPHCVDEVIAEFRRRAVLRPEAWADVAAAYYLRAQKDDRASDLFAAWEAARQAVLSVPDSREGHFNLALAQQQLAMRDDALQSWRTVVRLEPSASPWAAFARNRITELEKPYPVFQKNLVNAALATNDAAALAALMKEQPYSAVRYFEEALLPRWATERTPQAFQEARLYASVLSKRLDNDLFALDVVESLIASRKPDLMRRGFLSYASGDYPAAADVLEQAGSPFALRAQQQHLGRNVLNMESDPANIAPVEALVSRAKRYVHLSGELQSLLGLALWGGGRSTDALEAYARAEQKYVQAGDQQKQCEAVSRVIGNWGLVGKHETAMREVLRVGRCASLLDPAELNKALCEAAKTAVALHYPEAALAYMHHAVRVPAPAREKAVALRERAAVHLALGQTAAAQMDFEDARRTYPPLEKLPAASFQARILELRAELTDNIDLLTKAIETSLAGQHPTFTALLYTKRAAERTGPAADADRRSALEIIRNEEKEILRRRQIGKFEDLWGAYFNRFRDTYDALVKSRMEARDAAEAFGYSERMRAFDLLDLLDKRSDLPAEFRRIAEQDVVSHESIREQLPDGTVIVSYMNLADRTYVWILSRTRFESLRLRVGRRQIERWKEEVLRVAEGTSDRQFTDATHAPHQELLAPVLRAVGPVKRLVLVPDEPMQGLPFPAMRGDNTPFVVEQVLLEVAPSATLYVYSLLQDRALQHEGPLSVLLIGDPTFAASVGQPQLPDARREVATIEAQYGTTATVLRLIGDAATAPRFFAEAPRHEVVHLATHTIVDEVRPDNSVILLAHENVSIRDLLQKLELHRTRLFVLASCKSAGGIPVGPEGVAPLVRPLLAAGVPAVVGSLWNVRDDIGEQFAVSFHRHYRDTRDAAVALRAAQLELLHGDQEVREWAPFLMIGHHSISK